MRKLIIALLLFAQPSLAQQQPASSVALQINNAVSNLALELDQARQLNAGLQKQLSEAQEKLKASQPKPSSEQEEKH